MWTLLSWFKVRHQWRDVMKTEMKRQVTLGWRRGTFLLMLNRPDASIKDTDVKRVSIAVSEHFIESGHRIKFYETEALAKKHQPTWTDLSNKLHLYNINREEAFKLSKAWNPSGSLLKQSNV
jgi:hypothetical protein